MALASWSKRLPLHLGHFLVSWGDRRRVFPYRRYPTAYGHTLGVARLTIRMKTYMRYTEHPGCTEELPGCVFSCPDLPTPREMAPRAAVLPGGPQPRHARLVFGVYFAGARAGDVLRVETGPDSSTGWETVVAHPERFQYMLPYGHPYDGSMDTFSDPPRFYINSVRVEPDCHLAVHMWERLGYRDGKLHLRGCGPEADEFAAGARDPADLDDPEVDKEFMRGRFPVAFSTRMTICGLVRPVYDIHTGGQALGLFENRKGMTLRYVALHSLCPISGRYGAKIVRAVVEYMSRPGRALYRLAAASYAAASQTM